MSGWLPPGETEAEHRCMACGEWHSLCFCTPEQVQEAEDREKEERYGM